MQKAVGTEYKMASSQLPPSQDGQSQGALGEATPALRSVPQHGGSHTWKMWYFMSLISMVLPLSPSCSDLLVISVLNLEQRG